MSEFQGKHWGKVVSELLTDDITVEDLYQAFKARLVQEVVAHSSKEVMQAYHDGLPYGPEHIVRNDYSLELIDTTKDKDNE